MKPLASRPLMALLLAISLGACAPQAQLLTPQPGIRLPSVSPSSPTGMPPDSPLPPTSQSIESAEPAKTSPPVSGNLANSLRFERWLDALNGWAWSRDGWRILRSGDGGSTWLDATPIGAQAGYVAALDAKTAWTSVTSADPTDNSTTMYRTTDAGQTWEAFPVPYKLLQVEFLDTAHGWGVASPQGCGAGSCWIKLYQTSDGGRAWSMLSPTSPYGGGQVDDVLGPGMISLISEHALSFSDASTIWLYGGYTFNVEHGRNAPLTVSRDSGRTWQAMRIPMPEAAPGDAIPQEIGEPVFLSPEVGYFGAWYAMPRPGGEAPLNVLALFATSDGGHTWQARPGVVEICPTREPLEIVTRMDLYVCCPEGLCASHDGGFTWATISSDLDFSAGSGMRLVGFAFVDPRHGWVNLSLPDGSYALYRTRNGGSAWEKLEPVVVTQP